MASGKTVYRGAVALSRDLEADLGLRFGDLIEIDGLGLFTFEDRMHPRWRRTVDILFFSLESAKKFGIQDSFLRLP
jgi:3D (Asp-Asp-Asp) domain-containing protein